MHLRRRLRRPSPALVIATAALIASLTGTAVAAGLVNNEVRSQHIANGQVKRADIAVNAVDSPLVRDGSLIAADIQNGTLGSSDLRDDSLTGADIADGSVTTAEIGDSSLGGADIADFSLRGADVADDSLTGDDVDEATLKGVMPAAVRVVEAEIAAVATATGATLAASCAANERAIGGGAAWVMPGSDTPTTAAASISASMPERAPATGELTGWRVAGKNDSGGSLALRAYAFCSVRS